MRDYLFKFFRDFSYPEEAAAVLLEAYDKISADPESASLFDSLIDGYEKTDSFINYVVLENSRRAGEIAGVHEYTAQLLIFCCFTKHLNEMYRKKGIEEQIYRDSVDDLRVKLLECHKLHGIWGTFVAFWFDGFYLMTRFALGRLQFEPCAFIVSDTDYSKCGINIKPGDKIINVHLPSRGRLPYNEVIDSYKKAYSFFKDKLIDGKLVVECSSWLLYDKMKEILLPESNTYRFISDFDITRSTEDVNFKDCWRLFNMDYTGDPSALPRDTTFRRRYADWLSAGGTAGTGGGVLIFDGEKIINK